MIENRLIRFIFTGALNTLITYCVYIVLETVLEYQIAYLISYSIGILCSYLMNALFVFRRYLSLKTFLRFQLVYVVQYLASAILLEILVRWAGLSTMVAPIVAIVVTVPLTFLASRAIFRQQQS